jgi:hypothetical protein
VETPTPPPRCLPCGKRIYATQAEAVQDALRMRTNIGAYRDEYRCPREALGGWHLRDIRKRYEKIKDHGGPEAAALAEKMRRLDLLAAKDPDRQLTRRERRGTLESQLRTLRQFTPSVKKPRGRRKHNDPVPTDEDKLGTRATAARNELRRRQERARLREELLREEKDG